MAPFGSKTKPYCASVCACVRDCITRRTECLKTNKPHAGLSVSVCVVVLQIRNHELQLKDSRSKQEGKKSKPNEPFSLSIKTDICRVLFRIIRDVDEERMNCCAYVRGRRNQSSRVSQIRDITS